MSKPKIFYFCLLLVFLVLIIWRYQIIRARIENSELRKYNDSAEEITLTGIVVREPDVRETNTKLTVEVKTETRVSVKLLATVDRYPEYKYGDELKIIGKLQTPPIFEDFNYKNYLLKDGIYSVIYYPQIEIIARGRASGAYAKILEFKKKLRQSIGENISPPQSAILGAMLLGDKNRLSDDWKEKLNIVGIRHITAVSGLHIVLLSGILVSFFLWLGFWRNQAIYFSLVLIAFFVLMTGLQSSGIRAGIMGSLFLLAQKFGRKAASFRSLTLAAAVMLTINPLLLFYDVGFQLSFLAALGIISLSAIFKRWLKLDILAMTFSAYFFTLPVLIYNFGQVSLAAPLTNLLILPFVYWIMLFGFVFALAGMFWSIPGLILSFPCWFLLGYLIKITEFFNQFSWAAKTIENVHWLWLSLSYLILGFIAWQLNKRERLRFLNY